MWVLSNTRDKAQQLTWNRFIDSEKWRDTYAGVGVEELVRTFDYKERPEVFKLYPQYYHKTDKVNMLSSCATCGLTTYLRIADTVLLYRMDGPYTSNSLATSTSLPSERSPPRSAWSRT